MNALEIKNLSKSFPGFSLDNLNLTLPSGCIMGLVGENGAGKSTTIKLVLKLLRQDGGSVTLLGRDHEKDLHLTLEDVGVVMDEVGIPACLNARQVGKIMALTYKNWQPDVFEDCLRRFSLPTDKRFQDLSRGMKMKLGIAIALSHQSKLLLLDEATSGLDPVVRDEILDIFNDFTRQEDHSILISSHIVSDLEKICDYIAFLHKGKLLLCQEKDRLLDQYAIVRGSEEQLSALPADAVLHRKRGPYGQEALALRRVLPEGLSFSPVSIEELFIFMVKEAK